MTYSALPHLPHVLAILPKAESFHTTSLFLLANQ